MTIAMDESVTSEQIARYRSDFLQVQGLAIGADDFQNSDGTQMSAQEALNLALPIDANFNPFQ